MASPKARRAAALKIVDQAGHVSEVQLGGAWSARVVHALPADFVLRSDVPATRAACATGPRPCPHVRCEHHLWVTAAEDRRGRRWDDSNHAAALEPRAVTTCELDVIERGERSSVETARALGMTRQRVNQIKRRALEKLRGAGLDLDELRSLIT